MTITIDCKGHKVELTQNRSNGVTTTLAIDGKTIDFTAHNAIAHEDVDIIFVDLLSLLHKLKLL